MAIHDHSSSAGPSGFGDNAVKDIEQALNQLLADAFGLYFKTKNFHWHVSGPSFRDYHLLLDDQATQILATTDLIAERVRKVGGVTLKSIQQAATMTQVSPNEADNVGAHEMLDELLKDNQAYANALRAAHQIADEHDDIATASLIENWVDETEQRCWFLQQTAQSGSRG
jgi:starvation-inducible DNA-binding protein